MLARLNGGLGVFCVVLVGRQDKDRVHIVRAAQIKRGGIGLCLGTFPRWPTGTEGETSETAVMRYRSCRSLKIGRCIICATVPVRLNQLLLPCSDSFPCSKTVCAFVPDIACPETYYTGRALAPAMESLCVFVVFFCGPDGPRYSTGRPGGTDPAMFFFWGDAASLRPACSGRAAGSLPRSTISQARVSEEISWRACILARRSSVFCAICSIRLVDCGEGRREAAGHGVVVKAQDRYVLGYAAAISRRREIAPAARSSLKAKMAVSSGCGAPSAGRSPCSRPQRSCRPAGSGCRRRADGRPPWPCGRRSGAGSPRRWPGTHRSGNRFWCAQGPMR